MVAVLVPLVGRPRAQMEPLVASFFQCAAARDSITLPLSLSQIRASCPASPLPPRRRPFNRHVIPRCI
jgi:hypothetical protein